MCLERHENIKKSLFYKGETGRTLKIEGMLTCISQICYSRSCGNLHRSLVSPLVDGYSCPWVDAVSPSLLRKKRFFFWSSTCLRQADHTRSPCLSRFYSCSSRAVLHGLRGVWDGGRSGRHRPPMVYPNPGPISRLQLSYHISQGVHCLATVDNQGLHDLGVYLLVCYSIPSQLCTAGLAWELNKCVLLWEVPRRSVGA